MQPEQIILRVVDSYSKVVLASIKVSHAWIHLRFQQETIAEAFYL